MFPYRLAAIDLDDTLLGPDKLISAANAAAVSTLRERGVHVVLASGRRHENMHRFHRQLDLSGPIVSCNGAQVRHAETGEVWHQRLMPVDLAADVISEGDRLGMTQNFYHIDGNLYVPEKTPWTSLYQDRTLSEVTPIGDLKQLLPSAPLKIIWVADPRDVERLFPIMQARYTERLYVTVTDPEYLEFMDPGVSKAVGVAVAAERLSIPPEQVVAFGDGNNDVPMLEWAGLGVAMANARESAKQAADRIAPPGNPETAFARAVESLL